jgi:large subunit ribosomal protein L9
METAIISLENRKNIRLGETIRVRRGYARYLISQHKAVPDNTENREKFAAMRAELEQKEADRLQEMEARAEQLKQLDLQISSRAADESRLYGSLGPRELAAAITERGVPVQKNEIRLSNGPIRHLGEHEINIVLHAKVKVTLTVKIVPATA